MPLRILVLNGPNLNLLGRREPGIYGEKTYKDLVKFCRTAGASLGVKVTVRQSNAEGRLITWIQRAPRRFAGIVINPAAYTHTSIALLDALKAAALPAVEIHLSDITRREDFRKRSYVSLGVIETITGKGFAGYAEALQTLFSFLQNKA
jgi:3-dehydroquinate dehydratase-2